MAEEDKLVRKLSWVSRRRTSAVSKPQTRKSNRGTRIFSSDAHGSAALQGFDQFRSDETLCDVVLVSGEGSESFPVHRVLMASSSDYFKAMFTGGMKEQDLKTIKLQGLSRVGLKNIIDFIYTAKVALNMDNLQDTLEAASFLQIMPVLDFCKELLTSEVTTDNCVEVGRIASIYHLTEVSSFINEFVLRNFSVLLKEGQYLQLSEDSMAHALASDNLKNCTEMELFKHTCDWLKHDESRKAHTYKLMKNIRFPLMTPSELLQISDEADFLRADAACVNLLLEASNYQMMPYMQPIMQTERTRIRSDANHLVTLGGVLRQQLVVSKELRLFDEDTKNWKALKPMDVPRYQHGIAVIGNFLYIVGGQSNYDTKGKTAVDSVYRYDPRFNRWLQVASLNEKRTFFHLSALKGKLYAVGGRNTTGEIASVECYNLRNNEWTCVAPISEPHYGHAGTVHGELMYISEFRGQTKLTVFEGDIRDAELLKKACQHVSLVIHTASLIDVIGAIDERELKEVNVKGTQFLLEACIQENVKSFIYTSSIEVAGPNTRGDPVINGNEDTVYSCSLKFPYSKTKFQAEQLVLQVNGEVLRSQDKMVTCALRPMYIYGEGCNFLLGHMDDGIRNGDILLRSSKKESVVNPVYVGNVAWAHILAAKAMRDPKKAALIGGRFYFISDDTPHVSYSDFNHVVLKPLGFGIQERLALPLPLLLFLTLLLEMVQVFMKPFVKYTPRMNRQLLIMLNTQFSFTYKKAQRDFGYTPKYSWEDARTITTTWLESVLPQHRALLNTH